MSQNLMQIASQELLQHPKVYKLDLEAKQPYQAEDRIPSQASSHQAQPLACIAETTFDTVEEEQAPKKVP